MLSVLVVSPDPSVPGGVSVFIDCMKRHLRDSRADSFFVGSAGQGKESKWITLKRLAAAPFRLAQKTRAGKYDVVHLNPSFDTKSLVRDGLLLLALRIVGFRATLVYFHGWDPDVHRRIAANPALRKIAGWILNGAALVTVLGDAFRDGLLALGVEPDKIIVTRTMFEGAALRALPPAASAPARPFILFMSRFDREKGGRELIEAFAALAPDYPDYDLVLAGDGADRATMQALVDSYRLKSRVHFTGYIGGERKWQLLRDCAFFALPTFYRSEGMPVAVLEAMGAGKPVLVGDAGAMRSIVADPDNGVVLSGITALSVAAGLRRLLGDAAFASSAGRANAAIARTKFDAPVVTADIENLYQKVAAC